MTEKAGDSPKLTNISRREFIKVPVVVAGASSLISGAEAHQLTARPKGAPPQLARLLANTHNLSLPQWGPYTKAYNGISHIPDDSGVRFDVSVFPGFYRRQVIIPNVKWESGYHPWEAAPDLGYFSFRYELEWKDQVYCDTSFSFVSENVRLIRCECVNRTNENQNLVLHMMASINFPTVGSVRSTPEMRPSRVALPEGAVWIDGLDYDELRFERTRPSDNLVYDGFLRGETRDDGFVGGNGISFGKDAGDTVTYRFSIPRPPTTAAVALVVRYRILDEGAAGLRLEGVVNTDVKFAPSKVFTQRVIPLTNLPAGQGTLKLISTGGATFQLDGFTIVEANRVDDVRFTSVVLNHYPEIITGPRSNSRLLKYQDIATYYGIAWGYDKFEVREFQTDELDSFFRLNVHEHVRAILKGKGDGHFTNVYLRPITLAPQSTQVVYAAVSAGGSKLEAERTLTDFKFDAATCEGFYKGARGKVVNLAATPAGKPYLFSQERMAATVLTNVVYPIYTKRSYIKHYTPGRWWDSLYTWDSGFIGLGLAELDTERAVDCLNAYVTEPGDRDAAFIHHGSPVPVQIYLFQELWNRTQSKELLEHFYPRLRQYHNFVAGRSGSSTTRRLKSNLLTTWDYFYNSGGWDDYPPQVYVHKEKLEASVAPVVNTAHAVRTAKILRMAASALGLAADVAAYEADINIFSDALQRYAWDGEAGYFGYVRHDGAGKPVGVLRHASGANFNMGLDGASPLIAGICDAEQERMIVERLMSEGRMWTPIGLSTVDRSAPYYTPDGYWNGAVWMPHQWFFWKTLLDLGRGNQAYRIAQTGLDVWKRETDESYNCFEHFIVQSGRGAGWHQFGALSTPVLAWFAAYHRPGRLTCGFDTWIVNHQFTEDNRRLTAKLRLSGAASGESGTTRTVNVIATMNPADKYQVTWRNTVAFTKELRPGVLQITLPRNPAEGELSIAQESIGIPAVRGF